MSELKIVNSTNRFFIFLVFILVIFGLLILTSATGPVAYEKFKNTYYFVTHQILFGVIPGLLAFLFFYKVDYQIWKKLAWPLYVFSLLLLVLVFIPGIGMELNGSKSWLTLFGYSFQPAEFAKLSLIILAAFLLSKQKKPIQNWQEELLPILSVIAPVFILILLQPDVGTLSVLTVILFCLLYVARVPKWHLMILGLLGIIVFISLVISTPYRLKRFTVFLHPELDPKGEGYHINQAFLAIGSGGVWGLGYGQSRQKYQYLPEVSADSVFAILSEELGFIFSTGMVILILLITWQGLKIAKQSPDQFGTLLTAGVVVWFAWQSFLNIGAIVGVLPLTGVPLPLVSHGGSAMVTMLGAFGLAGGVSRRGEN